LYLSIEEMRFSDRLRVHIEVHPSILDAAVPHMALQPLVENAIRHGIAKRALGGTIGIYANLDGERLRLAIKDDGPGFSEGCPTSGHSLGLTNLRSRLERLYSTRADLVIEQSKPGAMVTITIPYRAHPDAERTAFMRTFTSGAHLSGALQGVAHSSDNKAGQV
jgi:two-component system, LytTR family, sensor kinase